MARSFPFNIFKRYADEKDGATAVEFALIAWAFLLLLFGIIEVSRLMWTHNALQYAVENASRFVVVNEDAAPGEILTIAQNSLTDMRIDPDTLILDTDFYTEDGTDYVELTAEFAFTTVITGLIPIDFQGIALSTNIKRPLIWNEGDD